MSIYKKTLPDTLDNKIFRAIQKRLQAIQKGYKTAQFLSELFSSLEMHELAKRIATCYRRLRGHISPQNRLSIISFDHCEIRVCPFCSYRWASGKAKKYAWHIESLAAQGYRLQFLTLTVANMPILDRAVLNRLWDCWGRLRRQKLFKNCVATLACMEVKRNEYDWHPHLHIILIGGKKISEDAVREAWCKLTGGHIVNDRLAKFSIYNLITYSLKITRIQNAEELRQLHSSIDKFRLVCGTGKLRGIKDHPIPVMPTDSFNEGSIDSFSIDAADIDNILCRLNALLGEN